VPVDEALEAVLHAASAARAALAAASDGRGVVMLTAQQFADRLQLDAETVNRWCRQGRFPRARSLGRAGWRIPDDYIGSAGAGPATNNPFEPEATGFAVPGDSESDLDEFERQIRAAGAGVEPGAR
jgi:hypothetical protein